MKIIRLTPACKDYPWGGALLREKYGVNSDLEPLAEAWVLSCHPDGESIIAEGEHQGQRLSGYAAQYGANFWGTKCEEFGGLPLLIKLIDAKTNLSIQVHPDNAYALEHEHQYGKTEMWYVMEAAPDAYLYYGLKESVTKGELSKSITDGTIIDLLRAVPVHAGDLFFIPAGTIHAICRGTVIAEIQQNSNVTYRVFDYNRIGKDGKKRQLHVQQALRFLYKGIIIKHNKTEPTYTKTSLFLCEKRRFFMARTEKGGGIFLSWPGREVWPFFIS